MLRGLLRTSPNKNCSSSGSLRTGDYLRVQVDPLIHGINVLKDTYAQVCSCRLFRDRPASGGGQPIINIRNQLLCSLTNERVELRKQLARKPSVRKDRAFNSLIRLTRCQVEIQGRGEVTHGGTKVLKHFGRHWFGGD